MKYILFCAPKGKFCPIGFHVDPVVAMKRFLPVAIQIADRMGEGSDAAAVLS